MTMEPTQSLMLLAHGSRHPGVVRWVEELACQLRQALVEFRIEAAFLEYSEPSVEQVFDRLAGFGAKACTVVPLLLSECRHAQIDVPAAVEAARRAYPRMSIELAPIVGGHRAVAALSLRLFQTATSSVHRSLPWRYLFVGRGGSDVPYLYRQLTEFLRGRGTPEWVSDVRCALLTDESWESELERSVALPLIVQPHLMFSGTLADRIQDRVTELRSDTSVPTRMVPVLGPAPELSTAVIDLVQTFSPQALHAGSRSTVNLRIEP